MLGKLIPPQFQIAAYVIAALAITGAGYMVYDAIYDRGYDAASKVFEQKALDQKAANELAIKKAEDVLRGEIANLLKEKERLEDDVARLNQEAAQDPGASDDALGLGSVQRLNSVR